MIRQALDAFDFLAGDLLMPVGRGSAVFVCASSTAGGRDSIPPWGIRHESATMGVKHGAAQVPLAREGKLNVQDGCGC